MSTRFGITLRLSFATPLWRYLRPCLPRWVCISPPIRLSSQIHRYIVSCDTIASPLSLHLPAICSWINLLLNISLTCSLTDSVNKHRRRFYCCRLSALRCNKSITYLPLRLSQFRPSSLLIVLSLTPIASAIAFCVIVICNIA